MTNLSISTGFVFGAALFLCGLAAVPVKAGPPASQTPAPVIYLADNLDEQDNLGWCIDTRGRGLSDRLHAHSCKPRGGDVQFKYVKKTMQIASATYENLCAQLLDPPAQGVRLALVKCVADAPAQRFGFNGQKGEFYAAGKRALCLVVGANSRSAGPFMSRDLELAPCGSTQAKYKTWRIKGG